MLSKWLPKRKPSEHLSRFWPGRSSLKKLQLHKLAQAPTQAAEKAINEQKEKASKELHDTSIAQGAAQSTLASFSANQLGNQQGVSIPSYQLEFISYSSAVHNATVQPQGQQGAVHEGQSYQRTNVAIPCVHLSVVRKCCCKEQIRWLKVPPLKWLLLRILLPVHQIPLTSMRQGSKQKLRRSK